MSVYHDGRNLLDSHYIATSNFIPDAQPGGYGRYLPRGAGNIYAGLCVN